MAYATPTDVRKAIAPGGDQDSSTAASLSDSDLLAEIANAQEQVDAGLRGRYTVPFSSAPSLVATITTDIAAYLATLTFRRGDPLDVDDPIRLRYVRAREMLTGLVKGDLELDAAQPDPSTGEVAVVNPLYEGNMFTLDDFQLGSAPPVGFDYYRYRG